MPIEERPPKILILGEARVVHTQRWARHFQNRGWTVRCLSFGPILPEMKSEPLGGRGLPKVVAIVAAVPHVRRITAAFRPDLISALFVPDYGWLAAMAGAHPLVVSAWGSDILISPQRSPLHRWRIRHVLRRADHLFADAELLRARMCTLGASDDKITIVPLGVEDKWLEVGARRTGSGQHEIVVVHNRRLEPLYRPETLIRAAAQLSATEPGRYCFEIVGEGSHKPDLVRLAKTTEAPVRFRPWMSDDALRVLLSEAQIYVSASASDGTSVSLLEAMAAGCFPVVTDLPTNREWIDAGVNGLLFPVGDAAALARQIRLAADDGDLRQRAAVLNRAIIQTRARWTDNMLVVEDVMLGLIERHRHGRQS